jgi:acyl-coenzyme A thioesterase PaaI-like protein
MSGERLPHYYDHLDFRWQQGEGEFTARAHVQPMLCHPGTEVPRVGVLAMYADNISGYLSSVSFDRPAPTIDLSVHVFRTPTSPVLVFESRPLRVGRRISVTETWFTAEGEPDPFAVSVASHIAVGDPTPGGFSLRHAEARLTRPVAELDTPIADRAGIAETAPGTVEVAPAPHVVNGLGTLHGGVLALLVERACESAQGDDSHVVTGIDVRYLASPRIGPARAVATPLRSDEQGTHFWVEVTDAGDDDRLVVHALGTARRLDDAG